MEKDIDKIVEDKTTEFYCIAREDGFVPCEVQCLACLKKYSESKL